MKSKPLGKYEFSDAIKMPLLTDKEISPRLGLKPKTLPAKRSLGHSLPEYIHVNRKPMFIEEDVNVWLEDQAERLAG